MLLAQGRTGELAGIRQGWAPFLLGFGCQHLALGFQLVALKFFLVGIHRNRQAGIGNLVGVLLGRAVFAEPVTLPKLGAAALMAAGVALLLL